MENETSPRGKKSPIQDKSKEKHAKTPFNQTNKVNTKKEYSARKKQKVTYKGNPIHLTTDLSADTLQARRK